MLIDIKFLVQKPVPSLDHVYNNERSMRRKAEETLPFRDYHLFILLCFVIERSKRQPITIHLFLQSMFSLSCEQNIVINVSDSCLVPPRHYSSV